MSVNAESGTLTGYFRDIIRRNLPEDIFNVLEDKVKEAMDASAKMKFNLLFSSIPRLVGKQEVTCPVEDLTGLENLRKGFSPQGWSADRFCRVYLLLHLPARIPGGKDTPGGKSSPAGDASLVEKDSKAGRQAYLDRIEELFSVAEVSEQVALYSALPLYHYPESFRFRTTEGIRTNITDVFDAVALHNPYPFEFLDEAAWNQMVLKALFMQRPIYRIYGVDERANAALARILSDYAHERWSAKRSVSPELWRCFGRFMDESLFGDMERLLESSDPHKTEAAVLACSDSDLPAAKEILEAHPGVAEKVRSGELTWDELGRAVNDKS